MNTRHLFAIGLMLAASAIVWQVPHFWTKRARPLVESPLEVPQPETAISSDPSARRATAARIGLRDRGIRTARGAPESICRAAEKVVRAAAIWGTLEPIHTISRSRRMEV